MKTLKLILLLLFSPLYIFAQQLSGLWIGNMSNDSNTVRKNESFEIILSEYKGKVTGFSRSTFTVNDTLYYIVKRVKGSIDGDVCEVKDDKVVSHNFPTKVNKGVKVISTFRRNEQDSTWSLEGDWKTTKTKNYYSITGKVDLKEEKDFTASKLFPHLEELQLDKELPFTQESKKEILVRTSIRPQSQKSIEKTPVSTNTSQVSSTIIDVDNQIISQEKKQETAIKTQKVEGSENGIARPVANTVKLNKVDVNHDIIMQEKKQETAIRTEKLGAENSVARPETRQVQVNTVSVNKEILEQEKKKETGIKTEKLRVSENTPVKPTGNNVRVNKVAVDNQIIEQEKKNETAIKTDKLKGIEKSTPVNNTETVKVNTVPLATKPISERDIANTEPVKKNTANTEPANKKIVDPSAPAAFVEERKMAVPEVITFTSDSLVLALYDNGEIDGDTVSVLLNGEVLIAKQGLKASALKKTIYTAANEEEITLILYAENLGKYPPNTGLLVVYDGEERHQIRFSADYTRNAAIVFKRKK